MPDGSIVFSTKVDNGQAQKELAKIERDIEKFKKSITKSEGAKLPLLKQANELGAKLDYAKKKLAELQNRKMLVDQGLQGNDPNAYIDAFSQKSTLDADITAQQKAVDGLQKRWDSVNDRIDAYNTKIESANADISAQLARARVLSEQQTTVGAKMAVAVEKAQVAAAKFQTRIMGITKRVLIFSVVSRALIGIAKYFGKAAKTNKEFNAQLAKLKGALLTAFQPIYETIMPALIALMRIATAVIQAIGQVFSLLGGKTAAENAKNAKALYEEANAIEDVGSAAKKASRSIAGFDEINTVGDSNSTGASISTETTAPDFADFSTDEYKAKIDELTVYLSGALLALGAILAFSGANIPLGIGLMAVGAIGLATEIAANWDCMSESLKTAITKVLLVLGGAALTIGAILTFSGADVPLGIGLMVIGASGLGGAAALNWNAITGALKGPIGGVVAIASAALLALGTVLTFSGANLPLGIGLMALGAAGLATTATLNWDTITETINGPIGGAVAVVSGALLVLGAILTFSGAAMPLGIGLMVAGAAGLATTAALNWDTISEALQGPIGTIVALASSSLLVLGIILLFTGAGIPLGLGLILAGAAGLATTVAFNWNSIVESIKGVWQKIQEFWNSHIAKYFTAKWWGDLAKGAINGFLKWIFNGLNSLIDKLNSFGFTLPDVLGGGKIGFNIKKLTVPQLAQGAVLPANKPFLAMVGDQHHGTNIEAPLSTIQEAVALVMQDQTSAILAGFEASVGVQREILEAVLGIQIGDDVIGNAVARYSRKQAVMRGGAL